MSKLKGDMRDQWKAMMKEKLHQAVIKALSEYGVKGLTMERVAREAGVAKGTLYIYFKDKKDLIGYMIRNSIEPLELENEKIFDSDMTPPEKLESFIARTLGYFDENRDFFKVFLDPELAGHHDHRERKNRHQKLVSKLSAIFDEGIRKGYFKKADPMKLAAMFMACCFSINMERLWMEKDNPIEEDARLVMEVFNNGVLKAGKGK